MVMTPIVSATELKAEIEAGGVRVIDVAYTMGPKHDHEEFMKNSYAQFERLAREKVNEDYAAEHLPGAVHFNFDVGYYPGKTEKYSLYPAEEFSKYIRMLGVNKGDRLVVYSRGAGGGMLFSARLWWTMRAYGHENVSVLNGGLEAWITEGLPTESGKVEVKPGNWEGVGPNELLATFEYLNDKNAEGQSKFDCLEKINYFDARPAAQFTGAEPLAVPAPHATGFHNRGAKNIPLGAVITPKGLQSHDKIRELVGAAGLQPGAETVCACNGGQAACLLSLALATIGVESKIYNGSMSELCVRASHLINEK